MIRNILFSAALAGSALFSFSQNDPNRMIVRSTSSNSAFIIDRVEEISFARVEGAVAADIQILSHSDASVKLNVNRTESCSSFMINLLPGVIAKQIESNPAGAGSYLRSLESPTYNEDFENAELSGFTLEPGTEYAVVTLGIDSYGVECDVRTARFTTKSADIQGDPKVEVSFVSATKTDVTLKFVANADVGSYYYVIGEKGELEKQYEQFAPMFGFSNIAQMVMQWGLPHAGNSTDTHTFDGLNPNTDYEIYSVALDKKGNACPVEIFNCATEKQGGDGAAVVTITQGEYKLADWDGTQKPSQFLTFTPNDQTWCYRIGVYLESYYDANTELIHRELCSDPEMPMLYWFQYDTLTTDFQINENTKAVAVAAGKNANGEWGEVTALRFTTPATVGAAKAPRGEKAQKSIPARTAKAVRTQGHLPQTSTIRLSR